MKKFKQFLRTALNSKTTCAYHEEKKLPNLRPLEYCIKCQISICYTCGNNHVDKFCNVEWGTEVFQHIQPTHNHINDRFNQGYPYSVDLNKLKCPCGSPFLSKMTSTFCSACGTATCSSECHDKYMQHDRKCSYINNFVQNEQTQFIQGLRNIKVTDIINSMKNDFPPLSPTSIVSPKFIKSLIGFRPFSIILQRGFRQYGQPHETTLENFEELDKKISDELYEGHSSKLCMCDCEVCDKRSPHPIYNCSTSCEKREQLDEIEAINLDLHKLCLCHCVYCVSQSKHSYEECLGKCSHRTFKGH